MSDTIYRQASIDAIVAWTVEDRPDIEMPTDLVGRINALPSVERKKGKWILTEDDNYEYCTCSECGYQNGENWTSGSDIPFCANCGADMRGE